jgi:steroid delta-isomerase-like uncharacterized protein
MAADDNKELVRRFYEEVWDKGNVDVADEVFAHDYVRHDLRATNAAPGSRGTEANRTCLRTAFSDLRFEVEIVIAEVDYVAARWTARGTHTGSWGAVEATGRPMTLSGVNIFRFEHGRVAEIWNHRDDLGLHEQLGVAVFAGAAPRA